MDGRAKTMAHMVRTARNRQACHRPLMNQGGKRGGGVEHRRKEICLVAEEFLFSKIESIIRVVR